MPISMRREPAIPWCLAPTDWFVTTSTRSVGRVRLSLQPHLSDAKMTASREIVVPLPWPLNLSR
ncbi:MAG: hypothetical protein FJ295_19940 [Planctomycetes bacterium]|nr:hypothetical protein [Planctomycetota bacterium]